MVPPTSWRDLSSFPIVWANWPSVVDIYWSHEMRLRGCNESVDKRPSWKYTSGCFRLIGVVRFCLAYWHASHWGGLQLDAPWLKGTIIHSWIIPCERELQGILGFARRVCARWNFAWPSLQCHESNSCWDGCKLKLFLFMTLLRARDETVVSMGLPVNIVLCACCVVLFWSSEKINDLCVSKNWLREDESCVLEGT